MSTAPRLSSDDRPSPDPHPTPEAGRTPEARRASDARAAAVLGDPRWAAVLARDRACDGRFFYSVRTTGVFCRPACPARTPRPANVAFHDTAEAARAAGFRPCLRCRPEGDPTAARHAAIVAAACRRLDDAVEPPSLDELAAATGLTPQHFHRIFRAIAGVTPRAYHAARRAERMRSALAAGAAVTSALFEAGYGSSGRFHAHARDALGMTPSAYRRGGIGATIRFAIGRCALGEVLVACSETGVCAILLGDDAPTLLRELEERFPRAELVGADTEFEGLVARVVALVESPGTPHELPLDLRGTAFQVRVWRALTRIPLGQTTTYSALADALGMRAAVRAVAGACAANPLAVAIPCHRVVRTDGNLAGYRWGLERKRALLEREAALSCGDDARAPSAAAAPACRPRGVRAG